MKKLILITILAIFLNPICNAEEKAPCFKLGIFSNDTKQIKSLLKKQVRYANRNNFKKFISTYDESYLNADGFNYETYSALVKDIWNTYGDIKYGIEIKDILINENSAEVKLVETSYGEIPVSKEMDGELNSIANSVYYLKKVDGKWKVVSDEVLNEKTSMLYGSAKGLDIKLTAPESVKPNTEYSAILEFTPPEETMAIASIAMDKVTYPQQQAKEVFRKLPEDNILERLFVSNKENLNEYIMASIGLTKADIKDLSIKLSLTGFGYQIVRVNVIPEKNEAINVEKE